MIWLKSWVKSLKGLVRTFCYNSSFLSQRVSEVIEVVRTWHLSKLPLSIMSKDCALRNRNRFSLWGEIVLWTDFLVSKINFQKVLLRLWQWTIRWGGSIDFCLDKEEGRRHWQQPCLLPDEFQEKLLLIHKSRTVLWCTVFEHCLLTGYLLLYLMQKPRGQTLQPCEVFFKPYNDRNTWMEEWRCDSVPRALY